MKYNRFLFLMSAMIFCTIACSDLEANEEQIIMNYLSDNNLTAEVTPEGVYYIIVNPGGDAKPNSNSTIDINYKGYYVDGTIFDEGHLEDSALFSLIPGWVIGIPQFGKGGEGTLIIPSRHGYGSNAPAGIREDAILIFEITLNDFF